MKQTKGSSPVRFREGAAVYLRPIELEDAELYHASLYHSAIRELTGTQKIYSKEQIRQYLEGKMQDSSSLLLLIALRDTDEVIGDIALQDIDLLNRSANLRIALFGDEVLGKGYGSEAITLLLDYGFGILQLHRIELNVFDFNPRAQHVYEKLGFRKEGVQRDALFYNHKYHDSITMSILEEEYRAIYCAK
ncbi:GNAT family N-acetyltransferase [Paenibacillus sp. FJAT-26967]|uniref:GNAT family N-acetyltransferase n=1 Tax=Paenibacillus sp. FJAT-26967 TaxID=1729690 RepID=UPI000837F5EC|nr:GNAT family protein [Paenibacillus sp. FJAT-26967]